MERRYLFHYRNSVKNCFLAQNFTEIGQSAAELWCKEKRFLKWRPFAILNFENAHIWSSGCHRVPNVQSYTQCHPNRMIFSLSYGDFTICNRAAVYHLEF